MKIKKNRCYFRLSIAFFVFWFSISRIYADEFKWYKDNAEILTNKSVVDDALRWIGWGITKLITYLADIVEGLYNKTFGLIDITNYESVNRLIIKFQPVIVVVVMICIASYGIMLMVTKEKKPVLSSIILGILAISSSAFIFTTANDMAQSFKEGVLESSNTKKAYEVVDNNVIDLVKIDKVGNISTLNYNAGSNIVHNNEIKSRADMKAIDIKETLNWDDAEYGKDLYKWSDPFNELITYRVINIAGTSVPVKNYDGLLSSTIGNEFYYRYDFDFWSINLQLFSIILLFLALSYKNVRIAYELVVSRLFAVMLAGDIGGGQKLKQTLIFIRDTYLTLFVSVLCIKLYMIFTEAITSFGINGIGKGIVSIFIAYAVIDGPNLVERLLGMDAGLSSSMGRTMAMIGLSKGFSNATYRGTAGAIKGGIRGVTASKTGKTFMQRQAEKGNPTKAERVGLFANSQMNKRKENKTANKSQNTHGNSSGMTGSASEKMDSSSTQQSSMRDNSSSSSSSKSSGFDASFMDSSSPSGATTSNIDKHSEDRKYSMRVNNPEFKKGIKDLAPDKNASDGEKRDFNRQVNNIIRGNHKAIKPSKNSRSEYKQKNYEKALKLEEAYKKHKKEDK